MSVWIIIGLAFAFVLGNFMALRYTSNMKFKRPANKKKMNEPSEATDTDTNDKDS
ncbi:MAG: DUF2897 family protein [Shewanellaceae bacterium]|nr:DUF2897 family protein [Shewanellaceae bacterium]